MLLARCRGGHRLRPALSALTLCLPPALPHAHARQAVRDFTAAAARELGLRAYAYSPFHIFFEQYLTIGGEALTLLGSACVAIFLICLAATGSPWASTLIIVSAAAAAHACRHAGMRAQVPDQAWPLCGLLT